MNNLSKDYKLIINTGFGDCNKSPSLVYKDNIVYGIKDSGTCNILIQVSPWYEDLELEVRILTPTKTKVEPIPTLSSFTGGIATYEVFVPNNKVGGYKMELGAKLGQHQILLVQTKYRVRE